jgi:predicted DNA-binding transcriptional regulator AlpA
MSKRKTFALSPAAIKAIEDTVQHALDLIIAGIIGQPELKSARATQQPAAAAAPPAPARAAEDGSGVRIGLTADQVLQKVPVGKSTLKRMVRNGEFPRAHYISPRKPIWYADEVSDWQENLPNRIKRRTKKK